MQNSTNKIWVNMKKIYQYIIEEEFWIDEHNDIWA